jgi:hypothetical protein
MILALSGYTNLPSNDSQAFQEEICFGYKAVLTVPECWTRIVGIQENTRARLRQWECVSEPKMAAFGVCPCSKRMIISVGRVQAMNRNDTFHKESVPLDECK